ncbi:Fc.00g011020.m01.CDS01 [Cosmosporella sp. VM-42]
MATVILDNICKAEQVGPETASIASATREELLQLTEPHDVYRRVSDGSILTSPPLVIIEAMIDPYFELVNPYMPIWTKDGFRSLMASIGESTDALEKRAYDVCANNLALLTLQAKSLHSRATSTIPCTEAPSASSIDIDLIRSFIINAKRALENIELLLLSPSLLSLQALLSLCLVAQTSFSEDVTSLLFSFAIHVAKSIGLHQWNSSNYNEGPGPSEFQEKRNVTYCMVCLGRAVPWSSGWSSTLPSFTIFERDFAGSSFDQPTTHLPARVALLRLEEQVYTSLYSDEATRQGAGETVKTALSRGRKLNDWAAEHSDDLGEDRDCSTLLDCSRHELAVRFYSIQALAAWPIAEDASASRILLDASRRSIRLFQDLWRATSERGHYLNLALYVPTQFPSP